MAHFFAATDRCRGNVFIDTFSNMIGSQLYSVSYSATQANNVRGDHFYYNAKDLQMVARPDNPSVKNLIQMTDVDYYVDMSKYLMGANVILNTFVPNKASGNVMDGVFTVRADNKIEMRINGGAVYVHELWDYESDHIIVDHWWGSCLYLIEQKDVGEQKRIIFLNCVRVVYGPFARLLEGFRLRRKKMVVGDLTHFNKLVGSGADTKLMHTIAELGSHSCVEVSDASLYTCHMRMRLSKNPMVSDVERILRANEEKDATTAAPVIYKLVTTEEFMSKQSGTYTSVGITGGSPDYQTLKPLVHEDGKSSVRVLMPKFMGGAAAPVRSFNNDNACIEHRVKVPANRVTHYTPFVWFCLNEFVTKLIPDHMVNTLVPYDYDFIREKFNRPTQRSLLDSVKHLFYMDDGCSVKAFQKSEFYGKATAPRNISTLPMDHNARLGQYSYAFVENTLKLQEWYAFSKTPDALEDEVQRACLKHGVIVPTDISKCDGSRGYIHYCLDQAMMMRAFGKEHHAEILRLLKKEAHMSGVTKFNLKYEADYNTLSGSSKTSWGNTCTNAFTNYLALRQTMSVDDAWDSLGLYGGDDGLTAGVEPAVLEAAFGKLGMLLKAEPRVCGQSVPFLGRIFLDPWTTKESVIDVPRQLMRIHATVSPLMVPNNVVVWRKIEGYEVNDKHTPVIEQWCRAMRRMYQAPDWKTARKYESATRLELNWWARQGNFTQLTNIPLAMEKIAEAMDVHVSELQEFCDKIDHIKSLEEISDIALVRDVKVELPVVIDGIIKEGESKDHQAQVTINSNKAPLKVKENNFRKTQKNTPLFKDPPIGTRKEKLKYDNIVKEKTCNFFANGHPCPFGKKCKYQHKSK